MKTNKKGMARKNNTMSYLQVNLVVDYDRQMEIAEIKSICKFHSNVQPCYDFEIDYAFLRKHKYYLWRNGRNMMKFYFLPYYFTKEGEIMFRISTSLERFFDVNEIEIDRQP